MLTIKKDILILGKGPTQGPDDTTLNAEAECSISFTEKGNKFCLSLRYNSSSWLFVYKLSGCDFK